MCAALADLKTVAPADRQEPLDRQLRLLNAAVRRAHDDEEDALAALTPDTEGIGSAPTSPMRRIPGQPWGRMRPIRRPGSSGPGDVPASGPRIARNVENLPGDEAGPLADEERGGVRDVRGQAGPSDRDRAARAAT
jgi:hypothetical protein